MLNYIDNVVENSTLDTCQLSGHPEMRPLPVDGVHNNICCINEPLWRGKIAISSILNESRRYQKRVLGKKTNRPLLHVFPRKNEGNPILWRMISAAASPDHLPSSPCFTPFQNST